MFFQLKTRVVVSAVFCLALGAQGCGTHARAKKTPPPADPGAAKTGQPPAGGPLVTDDKTKTQVQPEDKRTVPQRIEDGVTELTKKFTGTTEPEKKALETEKDALKTAIEGKKPEAAVKYADLGETVFFERGPAPADELFDKAIAQDPKNSKAVFYSAFIKILVAMTGYSTRVEPLLSRRDLDHLKETRDEMARIDSPDFNKWYNQPRTGAANFKNMHEVQRFARTELLPVIQNSVTALKAIDSRALPKLRFSFRKFRNPVDRQSAFEKGRCLVRADSGWECQSNGGTDSVVELDAMDLKTVTHGLMAVADYLRINTAYSLDGWELARHAIHKGMTDAQTITALKAVPMLLVLERDEQLETLKDSAFETLKHAEELGSLSTDLCQNRDRSRSNVLFRSICLQSEFLENVKTGLRLLEGPGEFELGRDEHDRPIRIAINIPAVIRKPPGDLKSLLADKFDGEGRAVGYPDPTLAGLFPNGDIIKKGNDAGRPRLPNLTRKYGFLPAQDSLPN